MSKTPYEMLDSEPGAEPRSNCVRCMRAASVCICVLADVVVSDIAVLILQHPKELRHVKGTARLLHLCLPNSQLEVSEVFDVDSLKEWLFRPGKCESAMQPYLLYPRAAGAFDFDGPEQDLGRLAALVPAQGVRLVVLDGTWRQSRKLLRANPVLQELPRLVLDELPASQYVIRKAHRPEQLSSFEACALALARMDPNPAIYPELMQVFSRFVASLSAWLPAQIMSPADDFDPKSGLNP